MNRVRKLMKILEDSDLFNAWAHQATNVAVPIGTRNELIQIGDCSIVTSKFRTCDQEEGRLMVVGPNRMPYARIIAVTDAMSDVIEEIFGTDKKGGRQDEQTQKPQQEHEPVKAKPEETEAAAEENVTAEQEAPAPEADPAAELQSIISRLEDDLKEAKTDVARAYADADNTRKRLAKQAEADRNTGSSRRHLSCCRCWIP